MRYNSHEIYHNLVHSNMYERKMKNTLVFVCIHIHDIYAHLYHTFHKFQDISQQQHQRAFD